MKKLFLLVLILPLLASCSKDDDGGDPVPVPTPEVKVSIKRTALISETYGGYFRNTEKKLSVYIIDSDIFDPSTASKVLSAANDTCPNKGFSHLNTRILRGIIEEDQYLYHCDNCMGNYDLKGKPVNDEAKGYSLQVYPITFDPKDGVYTLVDNRVK